MAQASPGSIDAQGNFRYHDAGGSHLNLQPEGSQRFASYSALPVVEFTPSKPQLPSATPTHVTFPGSIPLQSQSLVGAPRAGPTRCTLRQLVTRAWCAQLGKTFGYPQLIRLHHVIASTISTFCSSQALFK